MKRALHYWLMRHSREYREECRQRRHRRRWRRIMMTISEVMA